MDTQKHVPLILAILFVLSASCFAEDAEIQPHVVVVNPNWPADKLEGIEVHHATDRTGAITVTERDSMLKEAGVSAETTNWRQLDKNLIFLRATYLSKSELRSKYPAFSDAQLKSVIETAAKHDAGHRL